MIVLKYYIDKGKYKEIIRDDKLLFKCPICGEFYKGLAYHTTQTHGITGRELRRKMGLKRNYQLITPSIKERHKEIVLENKETHIEINLIKKGKKTRYKKGSKGHIKKEWSPQALEENRKK